MIRKFVRRIISSPDNRCLMSGALARWCSLFFLILITIAAPAAHASQAQLEKTLGTIPVQHGGRVKPYASFAREAILFITGHASYHGEPPTLTVWRWMAEPDRWAEEAVIPVKHPDLRAMFQGDIRNNRIAPVLVSTNVDFTNEVQKIQAKKDRKEKLTPIEQKKLMLYQRARLFDELRAGNLPGFIPHPEHPKAEWLPLAVLALEENMSLIANLYPETLIRSLSQMYGHLLERFRSQHLEEAQLAAEEFRTSLARLLEARDITLNDAHTNLEYWYLKFKPFKLAWICYLLAALMWALPKSRKKRLSKIAFSFFLVGFSAHAVGFVTRVIISGRAPVTNMYESIIWVSWAIALFSLVLWIFYRKTIVMAISAWVAMFALLIGESFPVLLDPAISPLVPVLRSNYWLTIHVLTITLSYGAFALNWGVAHALLYHLAFKPSKKKRIGELTEFLYRSMQIGIILLGAGIVLGGVWASYSWGRFWGWDPKETWALIALMGYIALFHGRVAGWLDQFGVAFWSAVAFLSVIMAWYGVNFVLGAGLHSYGFGGGGLPYVAAVAGTDLVFLLFLARKFKMAHASS